GAVALRHPDGRAPAPRRVRPRGDLRAPGAPRGRQPLHDPDGAARHGRRRGPGAPPPAAAARLLSGGAAERRGDPPSARWGRSASGLAATLTARWATGTAPPTRKRSSAASGSTPATS